MGGRVEMLLTKEIQVEVTGYNYKLYKDYVECNIGDKVTVPIELVPKSLDIEVQYSCDYCYDDGVETILTTSYKQYNNRHSRGNNHKDCCHKCVGKKRRDNVKQKYGVDNVSQLKEVKDKKAQTCLEHYGTSCSLTVDDVKEKIKQTCLEKYGVDNPAKNEQVKEKSRQTNLQKYGVEWTCQSEQMKNNTKQTCMDKYGVPHAMQCEEIKNKLEQVFIDKYGCSNPFENTEIRNKMQKSIKDKYGVDNISQVEEIKIKKAETFYKNGTVKTSRQQEYLWRILGGELNYAKDTPSLDIAFPNEKIYIEFNGKGHDLCVYTGQMTREDFDNRERRRYYFLKSEGWKAIIINSPCDYLPLDNIIIDEINKAKEWFKSDDKGHWHYKITIGDKIQDSKYGKLRRIKDSDLQRVS
jgi:hypothetical protein